ncbi:hypothetical protein ACFX10_007629 [Malus domestica]
MLIWLVLETDRSYQFDLLQEREKKAKKSSSSTESKSEEPIEAVAEVTKPEKVIEKVEAPVLAKAKAQKDNILRNRGQARGSDALLNDILKRKKSSTNYRL